MDALATAGTAERIAPGYTAWMMRGPGTLLLPLAAICSAGCGAIAGAGPGDATSDGGAGDATSQGTGMDVTIPVCAAPSVTLRMQAPSGTSYLYAQSFSEPGDGVSWYSVAKADGGTLQILWMDLHICASCTSQDVAIGYDCSSIPDGGVAVTWNGTTVSGSSTCGTPPESCDTIGCAAPGEYIATMCAGCPGSPNQREGGFGPCVHVPFHYPTTGEVVGNLPPGP